MFGDGNAHYPDCPIYSGKLAGCRTCGGCGMYLVDTCPECKGIGHPITHVGTLIDNLVEDWQTRDNMKRLFTAVLKNPGRYVL